ncbi:MAG: hypothetical protein M0027_00315, partial [Candidatus Dormibacteraeota bacterium]|nr:hypothetical protein [Candidatus Dormibacteraeota bacterium]
MAWRTHRAWATSPPLAAFPGDQERRVHLEAPAQLPICLVDEDLASASGLKRVWPTGEILIGGENPPTAHGHGSVLYQT